MSADILENTRPAVIDRRYNAIFSHLLWLSGADRLPPPLRLGWKVQTSIRAEQGAE
jgi:hypothetical protein